MSSKSFKSLILLFMFTGGIVSSKTANFAACMESPKESVSGSITKMGTEGINTEENKFSIAEAKDSIKGEFLACCTDGTRNANYEKKVDSFLYLLDKSGILDNERQRGITKTSLNSFFEELGGYKTEFVKLWGLSEFDEVAISGFKDLFSDTTSEVFYFSKGFALLLERYSEKLELIAKLFKKFGDYNSKVLKEGAERVSGGVKNFLGSVGCRADGCSKCKFNADWVFPGLFMLLLDNSGSIYEETFEGLMRVFFGFGSFHVFSCGGFVACLADIGEHKDEITIKNLAELLKQFACLKEDKVFCAMENFASMFSWNYKEEECEGFQGHKIEYDVVGKLKDKSFNAKEFVEELAAVDMMLFSPEDFAKSQDIKKVSTPCNWSDLPSVAF